jgi:TetR/AcrR family transcriptional regulator, cholesterol catabolism regulator
MSTSTPAPAMGIRDEVAALKRERILTAAVELFYERGYENTTLDAVAERLGVTKPFIYAHFSAKSELLAEICARGVAAALQAMEGALAMVGATPTEKLGALGRRFVTAVLHSQKYIAIFTREEKNLLPRDYERISQMRRDFDRKLAGLLTEGTATGGVPDRRSAARGPRHRRHGGLGLCLVPPAGAPFGGGAGGGDGDAGARHGAGQARVQGPWQGPTPARRPAAPGQHLPRRAPLRPLPWPSARHRDMVRATQDETPTA